MKTIEKAKAYDEALGRAKGLVDFCSDNELKTLKFVFPELCESDDERIRKEILDYIDKATGCKRWVTWLEKQGKPATKIQRDFLFRKIKEAGYEWDAEKKELKEIENEEYDGEDYGIDGLWHAKNILEKTLGKVDGYQTDDGILDHKCAISAVDKLYKQKPAEWSEED